MCMDLYLKIGGGLQTENRNLALSYHKHEYGGQLDIMVVNHSKQFPYSMLLPYKKHLRPHRQTRIYIVYMVMYLSEFHFLVY